MPDDIKKMSVMGDAKIPVDHLIAQLYGRTNFAVVATDELRRRDRRLAACEKACGIMPPDAMRAVANGFKQIPNGPADMLRRLASAIEEIEDA